MKTLVYFCRQRNESHCSFMNCIYQFNNSRNKLIKVSTAVKLTPGRKASLVALANTRAGSILKMLLLMHGYEGRLVARSLSAQRPWRFACTQ